MKKFFLLATAALLVSGVSFADHGKKKNKKKGSKCCSHSKSCDKGKTAKI